MYEKIFDISKMIAKIDIIMIFCNIAPQLFRDWLITINSKGQLMISATDDNVECVLLKLFDRNGNLLQSLQLKLPVTESDADYRRRVIGIASDRANNVFLLIRRMLNLDDLVGFMEIVIVFDQHGNFQHEFETCRYTTSSSIAVSDDSKVFVAAKMWKKRGCVLVYNFNEVLLNSIENESLGPVGEMTSIELEGGRIVVLSRGTFKFQVHQFSKQGSFLSRYYVPFNATGQIPFLHKTEHVVKLDLSNENLLLYNKDGRVVREIKLKLSPFHDLDALKPKFIVTTQGLVAMLATEKGTGKRMIAIL